MQQFRGRKTWLGWLLFSPDGRHLAAGTDPGTPRNQVIQVWDTAGGDEPVAAVETGYSHDSFAFSPDGSYLHFGRGTDAGRIDLRTGAEAPDPSLAAQETQAFSADGRFALGSIRDPELEVLHLRLARWSPRGWAEVWKKSVRLESEKGEWPGYLHLLLSPDGSRAVRVARLRRADASHLVEVRAGDSGEVRAEWTGGLPYVFPHAVLAPDASRVAIPELQYLYVVDPFRSGSDSLKVKNTSRKSITGAAFSPDGQWAATASNDAAVTLWDTATWKPVRAYEWKIGRLRSIAFAPDGLRAAAGSDQGRVIVWDLDV